MLGLFSLNESTAERIGCLTAVTSDCVERSLASEQYPHITPGVVPPLETMPMETLGHCQSMASTSMQ
jgi:hypothetical protein